MAPNIPDEELRLLVRDAIARHSTGSAVPISPPTSAGVVSRGHPSHDRLPLLGGGDPDGNCVIEPSVRCTHCGYCQSMGH